MKKLFTFALFLSTALSISTFVTSCSDDDDDYYPTSPYTNVNGKPSLIASTTNTDNKTYYYYKNGVRTSTLSGSDIKYEYEYKNDFLSKIYSVPPPNMADGNSQSNFSKENNLINIQSWADMSPGINKMEINLNEKSLPIKTTNKGYFNHDGSKKDTPEYSSCYATYTYDSSDRLSKNEVYNIETNKLIETSVFEYENTPGMMSKSGVETWYNVYLFNNLLTLYSDETKYEINDSSYSPIAMVSLNYINNISKISVTSGEKTSIINYTYTYNKEGYPITVMAKSDTHTYDTYKIEY